MLPNSAEEPFDTVFARAVLSLSLVTSPKALVEQALALLMRRTSAREGYVEAVTNDGIVESSEIVTAGCSEARTGEISATVSRGIVGAAMAEGQTIQTRNAQDDPRFYEQESVQRHQIEAVLCVPVGKENPLGVIYLQGRTFETEFSAFAPEVVSDVELIAHVLSMVLERISVALPLALTQEARLDDAFEGVVGRSPAIQDVVGKLRFAAPLDVHVLLTGPSGTGKTQLARSVHLASRRRSFPFVELNCAAIPESLFENELFGAEPGAHSAVPRSGLKGKVEAAEGGTLFLDEIGELPLRAQAKILQLLQSKTYYRLGGTVLRRADVRIVAATNVHLKQAVAEKRFREDLFFRLKVLEVKVPTLAERGDDLVLLANYFLKLAVNRHELARKVLAPSALRAIRLAEWTGHVRQLAHEIEAAALNAERRGSSQVEHQDVFNSGTSEAEGTVQSLHQATHAFQRRHLLSVLQATDWNIAEAARVLDISRAHTYTLVKGFELKRQE